MKLVFLLHLTYRMWSIFFARFALCSENVKKKTLAMFFLFHPYCD